MSQAAVTGLMPGLRSTFRSCVRVPHRLPSSGLSSLSWATSLFCLHYLPASAQSGLLKLSVSLCPSPARNLPLLPFSQSQSPHLPTWTHGAIAAADHPPTPCTHSSFLFPDSHMLSHMPSSLCQIKLLNGVLLSTYSSPPFLLFELQVAQSPPPRSIPLQGQHSVCHVVGIDR